MAPRRIHFVTGKLAEISLRQIVEPLARQHGFEFSIQVMPITVAALMTTQWVAARLEIPPGTTEILLPGYCQGDLAAIDAPGITVVRGPRDLRRLAEHFGGRQQAPGDCGAYSIQILAEINHAPRFTRKTVVAEAKQLTADGADLIDLGCDPGDTWREVADYVRALRDEGLRVSIDTFNADEVAAAVKAGAELVLSVNSGNRERAVDWGCEVVVVPDDFATLAGLDATVEFLAARKIPFRIDPVIEPIGFGFAASLERYMTVRRRYAQAEMMMGIGNLTELTDVDSAGINVLLLGICEELQIRSVLTTQVIPWAKTSVRECDLARRLVHFAVSKHQLPKHLEPRLVCLRDPRVFENGNAALDELAARIKDPNFRLFAEGGELHVVSAGLHLSDPDPFLLFEKLLLAAPDRLDPSHAFYLGYELSKALTALTLGKEYRQDESLDWGYLTRPEISHRERKKKA